MKKTTANIREELLRTDITPNINPKNLLSFGSSLTNLACTDCVSGGIPIGKYVLLVGDSDSGKTWVSMSCLAEACRKKAFKDYRFILDDPEDGAMMDKAAFFGQEVVDRIEPAAGTREDPAPSRTVQEFYYNLNRAFKHNQPFIWILDSESALTSEQAEDKFEDNQAAFEKTGALGKGSYGDGKASIHSQRLRAVRGKLRDTGSILIIISQTRDNLGFGAQFNPKIRSGGWALKFFADIEIWTAVRQKITKKVNDEIHHIGNLIKLKVARTRVTGKKKTVEFPIYNTYGIDDIGSCIDYMVEQKQWSESKGVIKASDFEFNGRRTALIQKIESEGLETALRSAVADTWADVEDALAVKRKPRYS